MATSGIQRVVGESVVIGLSILLGAVLPAIALVLVGAVNQWDDAPGLGFIAVGVLLVGLVTGLITGIVCANCALGVADGIKRTSLALASFSLLLGAGLSVLMHDSAHAGKAYFAALVLSALGALLVRLLVKQLMRVEASPPASTRT